MHKLGRRAFIYHDWLTVALLSFAKESTPCSVLDLDRKRKRKRRRPRLADTVKADGSLNVEVCEAGGGCDRGDHVTLVT